jgi:hypothetical protein
MDWVKGKPIKEISNFEVKNAAISYCDKMTEIVPLN